MIALVAVSAAVYAIDKPYSYGFSREMPVRPGVRVIVPFGRSNRRCEGIVLDVAQGDDQGLKAIDRVMDPEPVLSESFIRMAAFIRERYFCTFYDAIKAMLPAGLWFDAAQTFQRTSEPWDPGKLRKAPLAAEVLQALEEMGGQCGLSDLKKRFPDGEALESTLQLLVRRRLLQSNLDFAQRVRDKTEQIAALAVPVEQAMEYGEKKRRSAPLQYEVLKLLSAAGSGSVKEVCYLTGASSATLKRLSNLGYVELTQRPVFRHSLPASVEAAAPLELSEGQQEAFLGLRRQALAEKPGVALLYGVTGSGKTAVYLQLIREMLKQGRASILLVPEIALTPQLIQLLMSHFGETVAVLHSALRVTERYDEWKRIREGRASVVIGTRSAVFAPVPNLGLLILDEEQEHTYKSENTPRYHAREVAIYRGSRERALVLLGSATPSIETMYQAREGVYAYYTLPSRYNGRRLPQVEVVDLKEEIRAGNNTGISRPLQRRLARTMEEGKQSILFLNRRGAGRCVICVDCGEVPHCPRCSVSLTYHAANRRLMCHYCGFSQPAEAACPCCGGHRKVVGTGTQKIQQELQELFPQTPVLRMDADTISASNTHEMILEHFQKERIPILVGTQMVTKGLNFEDVTLVGVVDADMSLYVNHFRAAETTFSMLTQVIGRAGRGEHQGAALVQTMTPEHSVIKLAAAQDYDAFYELEITLRRLHRCPPFGDLITVLFLGPFESATMAAAAEFRRQLEGALQNPAYAGQEIQLLGPSPAAISRINNSFRYRLTLHGSNNRQLRLLLAHLLQSFAKDKRNRGITAFADINSYE